MVQQAFILFHCQRPPIPNRPHPAECSNECDWFQYQRVFICRSTGFLHVCTEDACDRYVIARDGRPCRLTGIVYPLDYVMYSGDNPVSVLSKGTGTTTVPKELSAGSHANAYRTILFKLMSVKNGTPGKWNDVQMEQQLQGKNTVEFITHVCDQLWHMIQPTGYCKRKTMRYRADYHGLVVLYTMWHGFELDRPKCVIVPFVPLMRSVLPSMKAINQTEEWKCALYTPADKFFHACLEELSEDTLLKFDRWLKTLSERLRISNLIQC